MEAISNPNDDESSSIVIAVATVTSVAAAAVAARLYVRTVMIRSFGWDVSSYSVAQPKTPLKLFLGCLNDFDNGLLNRGLCIDSRTSQQWSW